MAEPDRTNADAEPATDETPRASEAEALASLREYATGPIKAVFTWSEAATVLELIETLTKSGIIEVAIRNPSVAEYMAHWEGRVEKAEAIIEAQSKALAEARVVLSDVNDLLNYIDDHGHMLKREWTPELRERVWSFADRIPPLLAPTPENPNG